MTAASAGRRVVPALLLLYAAFSLRGFLASGVPLFFDSHSHLTRAWLVARDLEAARFPGWSFEWYGGYRLLEFYSPGFHWLAGGLGLVLGDVVPAVKGLLWTLQLLAVAACYAFALRLTGVPLLAGFAALGLVESPERIWVLGRMGNHPSVILYLILPLLLRAVAGMSRERWSPLRLGAQQTLLLAAMAWGHLTNTLALLPGVLAFELAWLWQERPSNRAFAKAVSAVAGSLAGLAALAIPLWLPMARDLHQVSLSLDAAAPLLRGPGPRSLGILAGLLPTTFDAAFLRDQGGVWLVLAGLGAVAALAPRGRRFRPLVAGLVANLAAIAAVSDRATLGLVFFLFPLASAALLVGVLWADARRRPALGLALPLVAVAALALGAGRDRRPPVEYVSEDVLAAYETLPDPDRPGRTFDVTPAGLALDGFYGHSSFSPALSGRAVAFGAFPQGAALASQVSLALLGELGQALASSEPALGESVLDALYLQHVRFLVDRGDEPVLARVSVDPGAARLRGERVLELLHATPALFAERLAPLPEPFASAAQRPPRLVAFLATRWREDPLPFDRPASLSALARTKRRRDAPLLAPLLDAMQIDRAAARAALLFVEEGLPELAAAPLHADPISPAARFEVRAHEESPRAVEIVAHAPAAGFVRLAYSHDPELSVRLDGAPVASAPDALGGGVVLGFPAGTHRITLAPPPATLRIALSGVSLLLAGAVAALAFGVRTRHFRSGG